MISETPPFDKSPDDHIFNKEDSVYYLDKNNFDIYLATVKDKKENCYLISLKDMNKSYKEVDFNRILPKTTNNDSIYETQEEARNKQMEKIKKVKAKKQKSEKKDKKDDNESSEESSNKEKSKKKKEDSNNEDKKSKNKHTKVKKIKKHKAPIFDVQHIVRQAWQEGINDKSKFKKFVKKNVEELYQEFDQLYDASQQNKGSLFKIYGYNNDKKTVSKFWSKMQSLWSKMFGDSASVSVNIFNKKLADLIKLPNQTEANAKSAIDFFFNSDEVNKVTYPMFCSFFALFAPYKSAIRKIRDFFNIPEEFKNNIMYADPASIVPGDLNLRANRIDFKISKKKVISVYNFVHVPYGEEYLFDKEGNLYKSWDEFFFKNTHNLSDNDNSTANIHESAHSSNDNSINEYDTSDSIIESGAENSLNEEEPTTNNDNI